MVENDGQTKLTIQDRECNKNFDAWGVKGDAGGA